VTHSARAAVVALAVLLAGARPVFGQNPLSQSASKVAPPAAGAAAAAAPSPAPDPLGRQTPSGAVMGFLAAAAKSDWPRAAKFLDTRLPPDPAEELARKLKVLIDRGLQIDLNRLSRVPEGEQDERFGKNREHVGTIGTKSGKLEVLLARVQRGAEPPVWLFAPETLRDVPAAYEEYEPSLVERFLPDYLTRGYGPRYMLWSWLVIAASSISALLLALLLTTLFGVALHGLLRLVAPRVVWERWASMLEPGRWLVFGILLLVSAEYYLTARQRFVGGRVAWLVIIAAITLISVRFVGCLVTKWAGIRHQQGANERVAIVRLGGRLLQAVALLIGVLAVLQSVGINLTPVLAGLGVGGIAVALASQRTLENLFGGMMVIGDSPVRIGQFCRVGTMTGTVEDIGLRSTRIRTLNRTVIAIPNGDMAIQSIENFAERDKFLFNHTVTLRYETTADQLRFVLAGARTLFYQHPKVESDTARVRLVRFAASGLDVELFAYLTSTAVEEFPAIQEDLLLRLMDIIEQGGTALAFPSQTAYFTRDTGIDRGKAAEAVRAVQGWRERGELPFPDESPERKTKLAGGIEYPPAGSIGTRAGNRD
jgi:MscS family membrane protein